LTFISKRVNYAIVVGKSGERGGSTFFALLRHNMSSFKGSYTYAVDNKGRVNLPAHLRKYVSPEANETFIITRGFEKCLFVYPLDEWGKLEEKLRELSSYNPQDRLFMRVLLEYAKESQLDGQARITIPQQLIEYAGIRDEVRVIGVLEKIELWNPKIYEEYLTSQSESYETIAAKVMGHQ
jgi:MraZ protein